MIGSAGPDRQKITLVQIIAAALLVVAPIGYFVAAVTLSGQGIGESSAGTDLAYYILLVMAFGLPAIIPLWERFFIGSLRRLKPEAEARKTGWFTAMIFRTALVETCFIFGLVVVLLTGELSRLWIFYAIGAVWAVVWWPTPGRIAHFMEKVTAP